jgi:acetyl esterase/lipase
MAVILGLTACVLMIASPCLKAGETTYKMVENIPYRVDPAATEDMRTNCLLDLYYPENVKDYPTVVWFHGGGLTVGKRGIPENLKHQGIAVVSVDYRLSPHVKSPAYVEDAAAAVAWTFRNIGTYGGSDQRIFVSGASAGGYLALMVGMDKHYLAAYGIDANRIAGLLPLTPQAITHFTVRKERGIPEKQPIVDDMAPLYHIRTDLPPIRLVTGDRDLELLGRYEENAYFWRMLKLAGHQKTTLEEIKGADHPGVESPGCVILLRSLREINGAIPAGSVGPGSQNQH